MFEIKRIYTTQNKKFTLIESGEDLVWVYTNSLEKLEIASSKQDRENVYSDWLESNMVSYLDMQENNLLDPDNSYQLEIIKGWECYDFDRYNELNAPDIKEIIEDTKKELKEKNINIDDVDLKWLKHYLNELENFVLKENRNLTSLKKTWQDAKKSCREFGSMSAHPKITDIIEILETSAILAIRDIVDII